MLEIYNSLTRQKEVFVPIHPGKVGIYVCGMTVYDLCHIGHGRGMINFDVIARYFRYKGYQVTYVRNITDIDDKIIARANEKQESIQDLTQRFILAMNKDGEALGVLPPDMEPRATLHIEQMIEMISELLERGYAYIADNGDVYYRVEKFKHYGMLANKDLNDLLAGARVAVTESKRNPLDFVLWKMSKPKEPSWPSPWGNGRPGWHIECSAMATFCLGDHFDIHGGGADLKFPHHENEIAQAEAATRTKFVNYWMHVGFVQVNKEKMSKSLGNFFTIRDVLEKYHPEVVRYFILSSHYRSPINYSEESLEIAKAALERLYLCLRDLPVIKTKPETNEYEQRFITAMDDDFNTPVAMSILFDLSHEINRTRDKDESKASQLAAILKYLAGVLGILEYSIEDYLQNVSGNAVDVGEIEHLIQARQEARSNKNWALADQIRAQLSEKGITIEDNAQGTRWRWMETVS